MTKIIVSWRLPLFYSLSAVALFELLSSLNGRQDRRYSLFALSLKR